MATGPPTPTTAPTPAASHRRLSPYTISLLAGGVAGTAVDVLLFPLDTLKTRLQSPTTFLFSGGFRGIYSGLLPVLLGSAPSASLFFVTYDTTKSLNHPLLPRDSPKTHVIAASLGELAACSIRIPVEVLKQRAQARHFPTSSAALKDILSLRHIHGYGVVTRELYRGGLVTILREIPFTIIQFPLWEAWKRWWARGRPSNTTTPIESAVLGSLAGGFSAFVTTPLDVLKTRMMLARRGGGGPGTVGGILKELVRKEGYRGLMKGWVPRVMWIGAGGAIFLGAYDAARGVLEKM
ncbi:mitochondrial carrier domain-containing protein [Kalaharituber pfeilii]|nr:mitochondrial carrier domain-containing protein [Kalaharituber pfeilii]